VRIEGAPWRLAKACVVVGDEAGRIGVGRFLRIDATQPVPSPRASGTPPTGTVSTSPASLRRCHDRRVADVPAQPCERAAVPFILHAHQMFHESSGDCICIHSVYIYNLRRFFKAGGVGRKLERQE
jgi:hypothetical protein